MSDKKKLDSAINEVDMVNHPSHYVGKIECIEAMEQVLGLEGCKIFCIGNAFKYIWRHNKKWNPEEDLKKSVWYLNKAIECCEKLNEEKSTASKPIKK